MKLRIFYSWQTTTATQYNKNFILSCIEKAIKKLNKKPEFLGVEFEIIEGMRGVPGSPSVASLITDERIPNSDIFIADLSVVNYVPKIVRRIQNLFPQKYKPFQNNNVINEHGIAYNALGTEKIIGVLNKAYGSPKENPDNIPFDLRALRFPIEYSYTKNNDKGGIEKQFVDDLANALKDTAIYAIGHQKNKYSPMVVWSDWEQRILTTQKYFTNKKTEEITNDVLEGIKKPEQSIRLLGLSGLGKTRILLEIFRPNISNDTSVILTGRVLYINCNHHPLADYQAIFSKLKNEGEDCIVILDNCSISTHRNLLHFISAESNKISLLTIDSNPEEIVQDKIKGVNYLLIKKEDLSSIVDAILSSDFGNLGAENVEKIKEFSQGIPLMAVLLADSVKNGEQFIGRLNDKELLDKLLGQKGQDSKNRTILKSCSIFANFGFYDDLATQVQFIASNKNITNLNGEPEVILYDFQDICNYYLKREIFEKRGRFIGMRPLPLAISLAQEWLEPCSPERLLKVIKEIAELPEPSRKYLADALSEQMKYLGYDAKAVSIIERIVGPQSPFDNAEVLNTELGSRLFRSFVEVNPVAISQNLHRVFSSKTKDELFEIGEGRRNLIWVLEKLCFDKKTFKESVKILYAFAVAENETWANNATGQLLGLFHILLPGTESSLIDRWQIIEWGLNKNNKDYYAIAIRAMISALNYGQFSRSGGAEKQGTKVLYDYRPTKSEVSEYWNNILMQLTNIIKLNNEFSDMASDAIANSIRSICNAGLSEIILPCIKNIAHLKNNDWDKGLQGLKFAKKYDKNLLNEDQLKEINLLIESLTRTDFKSRYSTIASSYHLDTDEPYSVEKVINALQGLADEFIEKGLSWEETLPLFYTNQQVYSYHFGKRLSQILNQNKLKIKEFIQLSLKVILSLQKSERNVAVLGGFISESGNDIKEEFYSELFQLDDLSYLLFHFISNDPLANKYIDLLFELIDTKQCDLENFDAFTYSNALRDFDEDGLNRFGKKMFSYGNAGYEIAFDIFYNIGYGDEKKKKILVPLFKECILKLGLSRPEKRQLDSYKWSQIICYILTDKNESGFAQFINTTIINSITIQNSYHLDFEVQKIYETLLKNHFDTIWTDLSEALLSKEEKYIIFYGLKHILGSHIGGVGRNVGVLFEEGNIEHIFEWCKNKKPLAPARLAELTPIFDDNNSKYSKWHPIALRLINEYGYIEDVLRGLSSNMGTYSWTGSVVPLLEGKKELFQALYDHKFKEVDNWAKSYVNYIGKEIELEKNNDAEMYM